MTKHKQIPDTAETRLMQEQAAARIAAEAEAAAERVIEVASETMLGDLMRAVLQQVQQWPKPWPAMSEFEQQEAIARTESLCRNAVTKAARIIFAEGRTTITATLEQVTIKDGIKGVLLVDKHDENRHALNDSVGMAVLIVVAGTEQFMQGAETHKPEPDQRALDLAEQQRQQAEDWA